MARSRRKSRRLSTIWRFEQAWEQRSSLKLRAGDLASITEYDQHQRIRHGSFLDMVDQAYRKWHTDVLEGKTSILIAPDNDTVGMLNERAQADRVIQGAVDAEHRVPLSDGLHAGIGDIIIARRNDRSIVDGDGAYIRNGTMLDVVRVSRREGFLSAVRRDTGATITLDRTYVESSVELGYATTAHRSQGITVDSGHTVVTPGRLTRELLYVSMTRGRVGNYAYVSENDPLEHEPMDPSMQCSWRETLGEVLAAEGAERTAHEVRHAELSKADSLERLSAEYDYLAQIAAAEDLTRFLKAQSMGRDDVFQQSPSWGAAVAAWRRAASISRHSARRMVQDVFANTDTARDPVAVLHSRLRSLVSRMPVNEPGTLAEPFQTDRPDLASMMNQVKERMQNRSDHVCFQALMQEPEWKRNLLATLGPDVESDEVASAIERVAIFRDRWGIDDSPLPLGPNPADYEWEQQSQRVNIQGLLDRIALPSLPNGLPDTLIDGSLNPEASLINVGWQL